MPWVGRVSKLVNRQEMFFWLTVDLVLLFCLSPNFVGHMSVQGNMILGRHPEWNSLLIFHLSGAILLSLLFCASFIVFIGFNRWRPLNFAVLLLLFTLTCVEIAYRGLFDMATDSNFWALIPETTFEEKAGYLMSHWFPLSSLFLILLLAAWALTIWRHSLDLKFRRARFFIYIIMALVVFISATGELDHFRLTAEDVDVRDADGSLEVAPYLFPFNIPISIRRYFSERDVAREMMNVRREHPPVFQRRFDGPEIVVVVVGESSSSSHWNLSGYDRITNPELKGEPIAYFPFAFSQASQTRRSVPMLMRLFTNPRLSIVYSDPTLLTAFNQLGYQTHWFSLQSNGGLSDDTIQILAGEATERRWLAPASFHSIDFWDEVLLEKLPDLRALSGKHVFFLHTLGSHVPYHHRYPDSFAKFTPVPDKSDPGNLMNKNVDYRAKIVNAYDNSILYTDHVLASLIHRLGASGRNALLAYASDHGQGLDDARCESVAHAFRCNSVYHVPMIFWANSEYRSKHADLWERLKLNNREAVSTMGFAMTILDLAGASYEKRLDQFLLTGARNEPMPLLIQQPDRKIEDLRNHEVSD